MDEGHYPMELVLLQETSITLTELDAMDKERKWMYYYYILAAKEKEREASKRQDNIKDKKSKLKSFEFEVEQKEIKKWKEEMNEKTPYIGGKY